MSSASLTDTGRGVLAAWETAEEVYWARVDPATTKASAPVKPPGTAKRKHPSVASNRRGEVILVWAEGTGWERSGALVWQVFDKSGRPTDDKGRIERGVPTWSLPTVVSQPDGDFMIIH
jgi:hypothetical protein